MAQASNDRRAAGVLADMMARIDATSTATTTTNANEAELTLVFRMLASIRITRAHGIAHRSHMCTRGGASVHGGVRRAHRCMVACASVTVTVTAQPVTH